MKTRKKIRVIGNHTPPQFRDNVGKYERIEAIIACMYHLPYYRRLINVQPEFGSSRKSLTLEKCVSLLSLIGQSNGTGVKRAERVDFNRGLHQRQ